MTEIATQVAAFPEMATLFVAGGVIALAMFMIRRGSRAGR